MPKIFSLAFRPYNELAVQNEFDLDKIIYDLDNQLDLLSNKADKFLLLDWQKWYYNVKLQIRIPRLSRGIFYLFLI